MIIHIMWSGMVCSFRYQYMIIMSSGMVCSFLHDYYVEWDGLFLLPVAGSYGAGVTIISEGQEMLDMQNIEHHMSTHILPLPGQTTVVFIQTQLGIPPPSPIAWCFLSLDLNSMLITTLNKVGRVGILESKCVQVFLC